MTGGAATGPDPGPRPAPGVYFLGAGPGDPELLTLRAWRVLRHCDVLIWADSLVHPRVRELVPPHAEVYGSAGLTLEELTARMVAAVRGGKVVARVHSGDPSLYGALHEQLVALRGAGVPCEVVPGVSSALAAAAALGVELTVPGVAQTVIFTRLGGRTPVPEREALRELARHRATTVLFLSAGRAGQAVAELLAGGYPPDTPAAVAYRVGWEDQWLWRGTLAELPARVRREGIARQALLLVGDALAPPAGVRSRLYHPDHGHSFRPSREGRPT